jgi:hypothetical protein
MYIFSIEIKANKSTYIILAIDKATCLQILVKRLVSDIYSFYYNDLNSLEKHMDELTESINNSKCVEINSDEESKFLFEV